MFVNIKKILVDGTDVDVTITEFYPTIGDEDLAIVPISKLGGKFPFYAFGEVGPDALSVGPLDDKYILSMEEYVKKADKFLKVARNKSDCNIDYFFDRDQMYQRYLSAVSVLAIAGVVSVTKSGNEIDIETFADAPEFTPADGLVYKLDLECYWKSLMFVMPNIMADGSTAIRMYNNYLTSNKFVKKQKTYTSTMVLAVSSIRELVDIINKAMDKTTLTPKEICALAADDEVEKSPDMVDYYKEMINKHGIGQVQATGLLLYAFETHYERVYDNGNIEHLYDADTALVLSLPNSTRVKKSSSQGLL